MCIGLKWGDEEKTVIKIAEQDVFSKCRNSRLNFRPFMR